MKKLLEEKVAVITGAARGIGQSICEKLASQGCSVVINYRMSGDMADAVQKKLFDPKKHLCIQANVSRIEDVNSMFDKVMEHYGRLDILINNATWTTNIPPDQLNRLDEDTIDKMIGTNLKGVFYCSRRAIVEIEKTQKLENSAWRGNIINISSNAVDTLSASNIIYVATKASINSLTRSLAKYYGHIVRINAVAPGLNRTALTSELDDDQFALVKNKTPLGRLSDPSDVADSILALITQMPFVTGQVINVDGGRTLND